MSPIDCIKTGIIEGSWQTVCDGYEKLTGESLIIPTSSINNEAQITLDRIVALLNVDNGLHKESKKKLDDSKKNKIKTPKLSTDVTEDGDDASLQLDDNYITPTQKEVGEIHLITNEPDQDEVERNKIRSIKSSRHKLQLNRKKPEIHQVQCNECQKTFTSTRPNGEMGQKCSKCLSDLKGRFS